VGSRHKGYVGEGVGCGGGGLDLGGGGRGWSNSQDLYSMHIKQKGGTPAERGEEGGFTRFYGALLELKIGRTKAQ
jgi:hypothetical protein